MAIEVVARKVPYSMEAEQSVLGCILISNVVASELCTRHTKDDFYSEVHKTIFEAMQKLVEKSQPVDYVTLVSELEKVGKLNDIGGLDYITTLTNVVPTASNFEHYSEILTENSKLRKLLEMGNNIVSKSYDSEAPSSIVDYIETTLTNIATQKKKGLVHISQGIETIKDKFEDINKNPNAVTGLKTGFYALDKNFNGGLQKGDLVLVAARPGVGKTSFAMNVVTNCALQSGATCAVFSLEMPKEQLAQRVLCSVACVNMEKALKGELNTEDWTALYEAKQKFEDSNIYVDDSSIITAGQIKNECMKLKREKGLDLVMIDYVQLMNSATNGKTQENRQQEISNITRNLKIAAKELDVPIILLSQLSRAVEQRTDHRPMLADLRESGAIEQDADIVMFIYNPDMYASPDAPKPGIVDLIVAKHRNGGLDTIKLKFMKEYTTFMSLSSDSDAGSLERSMPNFAQKSKPKTPVNVPEDIVPIQDSDLVDDIFK